MPAFNQAVTWQGYSDIVVAFNYEGPNNFTLTGFNIEPSPAPNYCLCVMWKDQYGNVQRYSLWRGVGEIIYEQIPVYSGQKIAKNFRFEIWSTNSSPAVQTTAINIYTSVLGGVDYRYGGDFSLISSDSPCTQFDVGTQGVVSFPTTGLVAHWRADSNFTGGIWIDTVSGIILSPTGSVTQASPAGVNGHKVVDLSAGFLTGGGINIPLINTGAQVTVIAAKKGAAGGSTLDFFDLTTSGAGIIVQLQTMPNVTNIGTGYVDTSYYASQGFQILDGSITTSGEYGNFIQFIQNTSQTALSGIQNDNTISAINVGFNGGTVADISTVQAVPMYIAEIFVYSGFSSQAEVAQLQLYIAQRYINTNLWSLPLVFPSNSSPQPNTI